jgi:hypothetical protein
MKSGVAIAMKNLTEALVVPLIFSQERGPNSLYKQWERLQGKVLTVPYGSCARQAGIAKHQS